MTVDAVIFDLGNTLVSYYPNAEFPTVLRECIQSVGHATGHELDDSEADELIRISKTLYPERKPYEVLPTRVRLEALFGNRYLGGRRIPMDQLIDAFMEPIFSRASLHPEAATVLHEVRRRGKKTGIVSNTPWGSPAGPWRRELDRHGLTGLCDAIVFCDDVGWRKPHPAPFERALDQLGVAAAHAIFVGDDPVWDVQGSAGVGMTPVLLATDAEETDPEADAEADTEANGTPPHLIKRLSDVMSLI